MMQESLWRDTVSLPQFPQLKEDTKTDVLIIGGGITGILCAYMLEQEGVSYLLVEADRICSSVTQNTTAKITLQHGLIYDKLIRRFGIEKARMYLQANLVALEQFRILCSDIDCHYEVKDSFVYSLTDRRELEQFAGPDAMDDFDFDFDFDTDNE